MKGEGQSGCQGIDFGKRIFFPVKDASLEADPLKNSEFPLEVGRLYLQRKYEGVQINKDCLVETGLVYFPNEGEMKNFIRFNLEANQVYVSLSTVYGKFFSGRNDFFDGDRECLVEANDFVLNRFLRDVLKRRSLEDMYNFEFDLNNENTFLDLIPEEKYRLRAIWNRVKTN